MRRLLKGWVEGRTGLWPGPGAGGGWAIVWLLLVGSTALRAEVSKEQQLKAALLFNFTKFVEWSPASFPAPDSPLVIGVLGSRPFADEMEKVAKNRNVNGHKISVRKLQSPAGARGVHLLFVSASEDARLGELRGTLRGANVLTVGESDAFARSGGVITFVIVGGKVRFDINSAAAEQASVKISAQLQKLARTVRK
jgi:hypothetical protein